MDHRISSLIDAASLSYAAGHLEQARRQASEALVLLTLQHPSHNISESADPSLSLTDLNILTLLQSIAARQHDLDAYESHEASIRELTLQIFGADSRSYYAVHLLDACECYLSAGNIVSAQWFLEDAIRILEEENGACALTDFLYTLHLAKLHFHMEQYYECIDEGLRANSLCLAEPFIPPDASGFLRRYAADTVLLDKYIYANLTLIACAYGKINNSEEGIAILTELRKTPPQDYYLRASMDLILAELYTREGRYGDARSLCQKYLTQDLKDSPDMLTALASLSYALSPSFDALSHSFFTAGNDGELPASLCYSRDALPILVYDHGLTLIEKGQFDEALKLYDKLGDKGLSLRLLLLAQTGNYKSISECKKTADRYYYRQIDMLFLYYNEKYVYNHLSMLEYHFSFCMDAYLSCHEALGREAMTPESIYDFLLNTKYISLEASYLSRNFLTLDALKNRETVTAKDIMRLMPPDTALLEFCVVRTFSTQDYCAFLVTGREVSCVRIADYHLINEWIDEWRRLLTASAHAINADLEQAAELESRQRALDTKLRRGLYRPIRELLAALPEDLHRKRLIIAPAGALIQFPFDRLSVSAKGYLGDDYEITYINTGKELLMQSAENLSAPLAPSSGVPSVSDETVFRNPLIIGNPSTTAYPSLPYAEKEAHMVAEYLNTVCYTGESADISLFDFQPRHAPSLLHIAVHGVFYQEENTLSDLPDWNNAFSVMEKSGLVLANDTLLSCSQISAMNLTSVKLAVLSACQSGQGRFHASEGVYGLRRALKLAGCQSIIASLWQIDDRSGYYFMRFLYENLVKTPENPRLAFSLAVEALRSYEENNTRPFAEPYFWAGYIFI
ncbi:MAG: CHAT domain-containing protein [Candidatus Gastranaerophilales bacterium]|nr:CHAT domain-containing protein [Candidatus Gastranaerophilales bacterium]